MSRPSENKSLSQIFSDTPMISYDQFAKRVHLDAEMIMESHHDPSSQLHVINFSLNQILVAMLHDVMRLTSLESEQLIDRICFDNTSDLVMGIVHVADTIPHDLFHPSMGMKTRDEGFAEVRFTYMQRWIKAEEGLRTYNEIKSCRLRETLQSWGSVND